MPYTMEDFRRDYMREHRDQLLRHLSAEERLRGLASEEILQRLSLDEIKAFLEREEKHRKRRGH